MSIAYTSIVNEIKSTGLKVAGTNKTQVLPASRAGGALYVPDVQWFELGFPSDIFSRPGNHRAELPDLDHAQHLDMRFTFTVSGAPVELVPTPLFFEQIDAYDPSDPSHAFQVSYGDTALAELFNKATYGTARSMLKASNVESDFIGKYGVGRPLPVGTHQLYLPFLGGIFANIGGVYAGKMRRNFTLMVRVPPTIIAGGAGTISVKVDVGVQGHRLHERDVAALESRYLAHAVECNFLQPHLTSRQQVLTVGTASNYIDLSSVEGVVAYHQIMIRPTGKTNVGNGRMSYLNIGDGNGAGLELVSSNNNSLTGLISTQYLRQHGAAEQFDNDWLVQKPVYYLTYCKSINAANRGLIHGGRYFKAQSSDRIRLHLPSASVAEVQTITFNTAPAAAGYYRLRFRGEESENLLGNATVATVKAAFEALKNARCKSLTAVFSAVASAGTSLTVTLTDPEGTLDGSLLEVLPGTGFAAVASTARTTAAVQGLPATGTYDIDVYSFIYRTANFNGLRMIARDLSIAEPTHDQ